MKFTVPSPWSTDMLAEQVETLLLSAVLRSPNGLGELAERTEEARATGKPDSATPENSPEQHGDGNEDVGGSQDDFGDNLDDPPENFGDSPERGPW
jgi:hypothetical protein